MSEILLLHDLEDIRRLVADLIIKETSEQECEECGADMDIKHDALSADASNLRAAAMRIHEIVENAYGRARRAEATAATRPLT